MRFIVKESLAYPGAYDVWDDDYDKLEETGLTKDEADKKALKLNDFNKGYYYL